MHLLIGIISIFVILLLALIFSFDRKVVKYRYVFILLAVQLILAFILLNTNVGNIVIGSISNGFMALLNYANDGVNFVFGGLINEGQFNFFINVLLPIVFISALIGILQYLKILNLIIYGLGFLLSKINGLGRLESFNAIAALLLGQQEVFISIKKQLPHLSERRLYTLCTSAMSTVSMAIIGSYMKLLKPNYVVIAVILNLFGGFIITHVINPYTVNEKDDTFIAHRKEDVTFFQLLGEYILDGFKVAIVVGAMLIGFIALIAMVNALFALVFHITFVQALGYIFVPFACLIGMPWHEAIRGGAIMATKLLTNEFAAMIEFNKEIAHFSARSQAILSVFLVSFANFSSIGIIAGALKALNEKQGHVIARHGLRLLLGASLVSLLSATIISITIDFVL